jgi:hypothetical protein
MNAKIGDTVGNYSTNAFRWFVFTESGNLINYGQCKEVLTYYVESARNPTVIISPYKTKVKAYKFLCAYYGVEPELQQIVPNDEKEYIVLNGGSFWLKSLINLEVLISVLKSPMPRKMSLEDLAKSSKYKPAQNGEEIFTALLRELKDIKQTKTVVSQFLLRPGYSRGIKNGLSVESLRKSIKLSV